MGNLSNNTGNPTYVSPYNDYSSQYSASSTAGATVNFSITVGNGGNGTRLGIFVDWDNDKTFSKSELMILTGQIGANGTFSSDFQVPSGQPTGIYRMRVIGEIGFIDADNPCAVTYTGEVEDYSFAVLSSTLDIAATNAPTSLSIGNNSIAVSYANLTSGTTISSLDIGYNVNNGTPVTQSLSSLSIAPGTSGSTNFSTLLNISTPGVYTLKVWARNPNGQGAGVAGNDTITRVIQACYPLNGNYTIDPNGSGGSNFTSFNAAIDQLGTCGVNGPVNFQVAAGTYTEQVRIPFISGVSSTNTISIVGAGKGSTILTYGGQTNDLRYTLQFDGANFINVKNMTIRSTNSSYGWTVHHTGSGGVNNIHLTNLNIECSGGGSSTTGSNFIGVVYSNSNASYTSNQLAFENSIDSCLIDGGYISISFYGNSTQNSNYGNYFRSNTLQNAYYYGVYANYLSEIKLMNNTISTRTAGSTTTNSYGIYIANSNNSYPYLHEVTGNKINNVGTYGIYFASTNGSVGSRGLLANNMIGGNFTNTSNNYGLYINYGYWWNIYNNSIHLNTNTSSNSIGFYINNGTNQFNVDARNNMIQLTGNSVGNVFAISATSNTAFSDLDYNNYYVSSGSNLLNLGQNLTVANYKGYASFNKNSYSLASAFQSATNLRYSNGCITGIQLSQVTVDIDGDTRTSTPNVGADEFINASTNDIGVLSITSPSGQVSPGLQDVIVRLKNFGTNTITSAQVSFVHNNGTPNTISWSGTLLPCGEVDVVFTGANQINIVSGINNISAYTSNPGGVADNYPANDMAQAQVCPAMSGAFTIDPSSNASNNFKSFTAAVDALNCSGLNGPVSFMVAAGTYVEQVALRNVAGVSSTNTITFDGGDGNAATRILTFSATAADARHTFLLDNMKYVTLRNLTILSQGVSYGWTVHILGTTSEDIKLVNCSIGMAGSAASTTSSNFIAVLANNATNTQSSNGTFKNILIDSCQIMNGYYGVYFYGSGANTTGNTITNTSFNSVYYYGLYSYLSNAVNFSNNTFDMRAGNTNSYAMYITSTNATGSEFTKLNNNRLNGMGRFGMYLSSVDNHQSSNKGEIINNMIGGGFSSTASEGIYLQSSDGWNVFHNSVNIDTRVTSTTAAALYASSSTQLDIRNNIFALTDPTQNSGSIYPVYMNGSTGLVCDYNNYYKPGSTSNFVRINGSNYNATNFIGGGGFNLNSYFLKPEFVSSNDLHAINGCMVAPRLAAVTTDYDGDSRQSNTTLGADEGVLLDASIGNLIDPSGTVLNGTQDVSYTVTNTGKTTITSFTAYYSINGGGTVSQPWTGSLAPCAEVSILFTGPQAANIPASGSVTIAGYVGNVNGGNDNNQNNDSTANAYCNGPLSGTYTINPGSAANRNFPNITSVMNILNSCGMAGDVELQIGVGTFQGQMLLDPNNISGLSNYRLTLVGVDSASSIITNSGGGYTVRLNGVDNVTFRNLGIHNTGTTSAFTVHLTNGSDFNLFENCAISAPSVSNTTVISFGIMGAGYTSTGVIWGENNTVQNCRITGGYRSVHVYGGASNLLAQNNRFLNNYIADGYNYSLYGYYQEWMEVKDNYISAPSTASAVAYFSYCPTLSIDRNFLYGASNYGLYMNQCSPNANFARGSIINNMIGGQSTTGTAYGIYTINTYNMDFYHNSVAMSSNSANARAFYNSSGSGNNLVNNIFFNEGSNGYSMYLNTNNSFSLIDYNVYYTTSASLAYTWGSTFADLASLQGSNTAFNVNSLEESPGFVNNNPAQPDLHLISTYEAPSGSNTLGVNEDIDGDIRCTVAKTIGADESKFIDPVSVRFTVSDTVYINSPFTAFNADLPGSLRNYAWDFGNDGSVELTTFNATYSFASAGVQQIKLKSSSCNGADSMIQSVVVVAPSNAPQADFIANKYVVAPFETVTLQDLSTNGPTGWSWSITPNINGLVFYDPFAQNTEVLFGEPGVYEVCLVSENGLGSSASKCKTAYITVRDVNNMCIGNLSSSAVSGEIFDSGGPDASYGNNENCSFLIEPCASSVTLKFSQFSLANAGHFLKVYDGRDETGTLLGTFSSSSGLPGGTNGLVSASGAMYLSWTTSATGTASGFSAEWTSVPNTSNTLSAGFTIPDSAYILETVNFVNTSVGSGLTYAWDLDNDAIVDAASRDIQFIYTLDGVYYPTLTVSDACGNSQTIQDTIIVTTPTTPPAADFIADARVVTPGDTVRITDLSTNGPISWNYTITPNTATIAGGTSRNPFLTFSDTGYYEITLDADNAAGTGSITKTAYIHVLNYCQADVSTLVPDLGINKVKLSNMENTSASGVRAFSSYFNDPTVQAAMLDAGGTYDLQVSRNTSLNAMNRKVWIDYNADGDFNDAGELVGSESAANTPSWTLNFVVPTGANRGATRMRIGTAFADSTNEPCGVNFFGEVEEYRVVINNDITAPIITRIGGSPQYIELGQSYTDSGATAMDAVDGNLTSSIVVTNNINTLAAGTYTVFYNVTDAAGNAATEVRRTVIVKPDLTPPILQLATPSIVTIPLLSSFVEPGFTAIDAISGNVTGTVQVDRSAFDSTTIGSYTIVYVAADAYGNMDTAYRTVRVIDNIAPVITLNGVTPMEVEVNMAFNDPGVTVTDNYDPIVVAVITSNVDISTLGSYSILYEAKDQSGNINSIKRIVNVVDNTAPSLQVSSLDTIVVEVFDGLILPSMTANDNYDNDPQVVVSGTYDVNTLGTYTLDVVAEDASGNQSATQNLIVKVVDTEAPVITLNGSYLTTIMRWSTFNDPGVTISDNYYTALTATEGGNFVGTSIEGLYYITYDVVDPSGNVAAQVTRAINVVENTTGLGDVEANRLRMYPNPATSYVDLSIEESVENTQEVNIVNALGQVILTQSWEAGQTEHRVDLSNFMPGVYYVQVVNNGVPSVQKLVISK